MNFSTPSKATSTIRSLDWVERQRDLNRLPVNREFNGFPPLSEPEAERVGLDVNTNFKEGSMMFQEAISQYKSAFCSQGQFFTVTLPEAPLSKRDDWSTFITKRLKYMMTHPMSHSSQEYYNLWDNKAASIVMHGPGLVQWDGPDKWCPKFVAIEDFRVPTDTNTSFDNLPWFAVRRRYTPGEIYQKAFRNASLPGWNRAALKKVLRAIKDDNFQRDFNNNDWESPTKWLEKLKQDAGYYCSDAVPAIPVWDLYFQGEGGNHWFRRCVADLDTPGEVQEEWLYTSGNRPEARRLGQILHMLPGDLNNKPPLKFHSMRSLGFTLVEPCFWSNVSMCWLLHHTMMSFRPWFRVADPVDRAKQQFVDIGSSVNLPDGVSIVPWEQRHRIDARLVEMVMAKMRQVQGQAADTYTQELDTGTSKERTAFETSALLSLKNSGLTRILTNAYRNETFSYVEICRRACKRNSTDPDCKKFRQACLDHGIDEKQLDVERWDVNPVTTMGQGNDVLELQRANLLMSIKPQLPPEGQDMVTFKYVAAVTKNPEEARSITQFGKRPMVTDSVHDAQLVFGSLMQGVAVQPKSGFNPIEQVGTLLMMMQQFIQRTSAMGALEPEDFLGLSSVALYVQAQLQRIGGDKQQGAVVKQFSDALGKIMNEVKALNQQSQQAKAAGNGNGQDPEAMQKLQQKQAMFEQGLQQKQQNWQMRAQDRQQGFAAQEKRDEQAHQIDLRREAENASVKRVNEMLSAAQKRMRPGGGA